MLASIFKLIFKLRGFKIAEPIPAHVNKCVVIAAPHTSNWDFIYGIAAIDMFGTELNYLIKKEAYIWPLKNFIKKTGGIPIERNANHNFVESAIQLFKQREKTILVIPPEGTRSNVGKWKSGFYHIALGANVPVYLAYLDYKTKTAGFGKELKLSGDKQKDIQSIKNFYADKTAKFPNKFSLDSIQF